MKREITRTNYSCLVLLTGLISSLVTATNLQPVRAQVTEPSAERSSEGSGKKAMTPAPIAKISAEAGPTAPTKARSASGSASRYVRPGISPRAQVYYDSIWGVDQLKVKSAESNEIIRFSYRVLDAAKAKPLNDEKNTPALIDPKAGVKLVVPALEKVGKLRQVSAPQAGKMYWMAFSNKGRLVKPGDRVDVAIGTFHAKGLVVE